MKCTSCGARLVPGENQCRYCGTYIDEDSKPKEEHSETIHHYHHHYYEATDSETRSPKKFSTTLLLCLFFGFFGIHRFYLEKFGTGLIILLLTTAVSPFFSFVFLIVDFILIVSKKMKDGKGRRVY